MAASKQAKTRVYKEAQALLLTVHVADPVPVTCCMKMYEWNQRFKLNKVMVMSITMPLLPTSCVIFIAIGLAVDI